MNTMQRAATRQLELLQDRRQARHVSVDLDYVIELFKQVIAAASETESPKPLPFYCGSCGVQIIPVEGRPGKWKDDRGFIRMDYHDHAPAAAAEFTFTNPQGIQVTIDMETARRNYASHLARLEVSLPIDRVIYLLNEWGLFDARRRFIELRDSMSSQTASAASPVAGVSEIAGKIALHVHRHYSKHFSGVALDGEKDSVLVHSVHVEALTEEIAALLAQTSAEGTGSLAHIAYLGMKAEVDALREYLGAPTCYPRTGWTRTLVDEVKARMAAEGDGVSLITAERKRQVESERWTPEHDDAHTVGQMIVAAQDYISEAKTILRGNEPFRKAGKPFGGWPWADEWWKPSPDPIRNLVKAGALIAAEIDRLKRAAKIRREQGEKK